MPITRRIFRGTVEDLRDMDTPGGYKLFEPITLPEREQPRRAITEEDEPQTPSSLEDTKLYVTHHVQQYNEECERMRAMSLKSVMRTKARIMSDVSTVAYDNSQNDSTSRNANVYKNYNFNRTYAETKRLPIHEYEKEIIEKISLYDVVVIEGETGCGKSTQVPQYILDNAARKNEYANIVVTQPRKIAAIMLADRVCRERRWDSLCAYQIGLDNRTNPDTRITYMTTEILNQKIIHKKSLQDYTHIILDEVHERDSHTDFALLIVKKLLHTVEDSVKVILMSATIDAMKFSRYFAIPYKGYTIPAPIITIVQLKPPDYKIFYYEQIKQISSNHVDNWVPPDRPRATIDMLECCISIIRRLDSFERADEASDANSQFSSNRKGVLVFLPGLQQIETLINHLREFKDFMKWDILPLHSSITKMEQNKVLDPPRQGFRKVIVSTNIAESSLTIHDVGYVIDFCLTKTLYCDKETNYTTLKLDWASQASCKQRAGRVGRTGPGRVYRLVSKWFFENLDAFGTPELCRTPLSECVLKVKILDLGEPQALLALSLDPPNLSEIHRTILLLKQIGALSVKREGIVTAIDGNLTFLGRVASSLPIDVRVSKLIVFGYLLGCFKQTITIAAGLSLKNLFSRPFQFELPAHMAKISFAEESHSDCIAILNAYDLWVKAQAEGGYKWSHYKESMWAQKQYLQLDVLREMAKLIDELTRRLESQGLTHQSHLTIDDPVQQHLMLKMCIAAAFYPYYFKQEKRNNQDVDKYLLPYEPATVALISNLPTKHTSLYEAQLRERFIPCSHDLDFTFEGSRAMMHLVKQARPSVECSQKDPNTVILQLALKMKQVPRLRDGLTVNIIQDVVKKSKTAEKVKRTIPAAMVPAPHIKTWRIFVTNVADADHFWAANVSNMDSDYNLSVTNIENIIKAELPRCKPLDVHDVTKKTYCLAPFRDENCESFYRARIESVRPGTTKQQKNALVYYLDYGNSQEIPITLLKTLPDELYEIPQLSVECKLCEIQPIIPAGISYNQGWAQGAYEFVSEKIHYCIHECQIYSISNNVVRVKFHLADKILNDILVEKEWAKVSEEPEDSRLNHHLREMSLKIGNKNMESLEARQSIHTSNESKESDQYEFTLSEQVHKFRGPFTTLEMMFKGMSSTLSSRCMTVGMDSVNSTALDLDYDNKHRKFIVSSFISMNQSETSIITRDTTLMPGIPGLMEFCLLMFSPNGELRINEEETGYSGAVVGLGIVEEQIYKNEDMEIAFDFNFTNEDILSVNVIRNCLNNCLNDLAQRNNYKLPSYQKKLQETIKSLVLQNRVYKKPEIFKQPLKWNCIPAEKAIIAFTEEKEEYPATFALLNHAELSPQRNEEAFRTKVHNLYLRYGDLRGSKAYPRLEIDETCLLCDIHMKTYQELKHHMDDPEHERKENLVLLGPTEMDQYFY